MFNSCTISSIQALFSEASTTAQGSCRASSCAKLGVFGYMLRKLNFPLSALILGYVLGEMMESSLRRALSISQGDLGILFHGPITLTLWALSALLVALPLVRLLRRKKKANA